MNNFRIPRIFKAIRTQLTFSDFARKFIPVLRPAGNNFKGPCPFHHDKEHVFVINDARQRYHCFACGADGHIIMFVMNMLEVGHDQAVMILITTIRKRARHGTGGGRVRKSTSVAAERKDGR